MDEPGGAGPLLGNALKAQGKCNREKHCLKAAAAPTSGRLGEEESEPGADRPISTTQSAADEISPTGFAGRVHRGPGVATLVGFIQEDACAVAAAFGEDYRTMLRDAVEIVADQLLGMRCIPQDDKESEQRPVPQDWARWVTTTPAARSLSSSQESTSPPQESLLSTAREGADPPEPRKLGGRVAEREKRRRSVRKRGDYLASVDRIIESLCDDMEEYAGVYNVEAADLVTDVFQLMMLDAPQLTKPDKEYADGVALAYDWFLTDMDVVASSFELMPLDVVDDVLYAFFNDGVLPCDKTEEIGARLAAQMEGRLPM